MTLKQMIKKYIGKGTDWDGAAGVQCFTKGHYILMDNMVYKAIEDVKVGDKVIGYDGKINNVIQIHRRNANVIKAFTHLGNITVTKDHPFYYKDGTFDSILKMNDKLPALFDIENYTSSGLTDNELLFLGFWLGDGNLGIHHDGIKPEIRSTYNAAKGMWLDGLKIISSEVRRKMCNDGYDGRIKTTEHPLLTSIIYKCYNEKHEKILPLIFNNYEYTLIIEGYVMADGSVKNNSTVVTSTSKSLLLSIQAASILCGYTTASVRPIKRPDKPIYINNKLVKNVKPIYRMTICKHGLNFHKKLINVSYINEPQEVFNIGTDGTHTYICDNYKVHNCVDVAKMYLELVLGIKTGAWGDARNWWEGFNNIPNLKNNFTQVVNTPTLVPKEGWIVIWGPTSGNPYGHIAVCTGVGDVNTFQSVDQNYNGKEMKYVTHNYTNLHGFLKPKDSLLPKIAGTSSTSSTSSSSNTNTSSSGNNSTYTVGKNYTLAVNVNVRSGAGVNCRQKTKSQLSVDGQNHALNQTMACLKAGTVVTVLETKNVNNDIWIRCPSGWLAAYYNGDKFIK